MLYAYASRLAKDTTVTVVNIGMSWLDSMILTFRRILDWKPQTPPGKWMILSLFLATLGGAVLLLAGAYIVSHIVLTPLLILAGITAVPSFGFPTFRCVQSAVNARRVERLLKDGQATYLMPGAFTHVILHPQLPAYVILLKRAEFVLERSLSLEGPRQASADEWHMFQRLFARRMAANTIRVCKLSIRDVLILLGGNLQLAAVKGEERFVADVQIGGEVEVQMQERGIPLNNFLTKRKDETDEIHEQFREFVVRTWMAGVIDLDVAFRNYLVRIDEEGDPVVRNDRYDIVAHDFGCMFKLPNDLNEIDEFLDACGPAGASKKAVIPNGAFLMKSLCGRLELDFAPRLIPCIDWPALAKVLRDDANEVPLGKRLKHHSNYRLVRNSLSELGRVIRETVEE